MKTITKKPSLSKADIRGISSMARLTMNTYIDVITWKQSCNRIYDAVFSSDSIVKPGHHISFIYNGKQFIIQKCTVTDTIFVHLYQGETANVCVDLKGNLCHTKGGMII